MPESLFDRAVAWARSTTWVVTPELYDDEDEQDGGPPIEQHLLGGQAVLEAPDDRPLWPMGLYVPDGEQRVVVYSVVVDEVPEALRRGIGEVCLRANRGLLGGAFELDLDDGDLRFRADLDLGGAVLDDAQLADLLAPLLDANLVTVGQYAPAIRDVLTGARSARDAVEAAESAE
jgi:hypothetical protein